VLDTLRLYRREAARAVRHAVRAWPVAFSLVFYIFAMQAAATLLAPLGIVGGFAAGFTAAALISSYLSLLGQAVAGRKPTLADLKQSFRARLWDVVSVLFAFWIINMVLGMLVAGMGDKAIMVRALVGLTMAVFFNPVPELLYQGSSRSFSLLADAARFVSKHGLEWLAPNLLIAAALLVPSGLLRGSPMGAHVLLLQSVFSIEGMALLIASVPLWLMPIVALLIHWAMVFRGLLFGALIKGGIRRKDLADAWRH
jgi:hypothetical protein